MQRRDFLRIGGGIGAGGLALSACGGRGGAPLTDLVTDEQTPLAEELWREGICALCPGGCGILTRVVQGRAVKIEGDPSHPVNRGGLCARGQAGVQWLYNPDRVPGPLRREGARGEGRWSRVSWDDALADVGRSLQQATRGSGGASGLVFLAGRMRGHRASVLDRFLDAAGAPPALIIEPFHEEAVREAYHRLTGLAELPSIDLERCRHLLSVGTSLVESGASPVRMQRGVAEMRAEGAGFGGKLTQVEPRYSLTAAWADEWVPARPGTETALLLALAYVLVAERLYDGEFIAAHTRGFDPEAWAGMTPERAAEITDVRPDAIAQLAREMAAHRPSAVLFGGSAAGHSNSLAGAMAAACVNALLGTFGVRGGLHFPVASWMAARPELRAMLTPTRRQSLAGPELVDRLVSSRIGALLVADADPVHAIPSLRKILSDSSKMPLLISFSSFPDDTASLADWILPDHTYLERSCTDLPEGGCIEPAPRATRPAVEPALDTRSLVDALIGLAPRAMPWRSEADLLAELEGAISRGGGSIPGTKVTFQFPKGGVHFEPPLFERHVAEAPLVLVLYPSPALGDGRAANIPWMQELLDPMAQRRWGSWIEVNPRDAGALGIAEGDRVVVGSEFGQVTTRALLSETVMPGSAAAPAGQGHQAYGRYAEGRGPNFFSLLAPVAGEAGGIAWGATRVSVKPARGVEG